MSDKLPALPEPQPGDRYLAPPAPDPPTEGWWLDPEDHRQLRYHNGTEWTRHVGRSTAPRSELPVRQGVFLLGAGRAGIPTGYPLSPGTGRYLSRTGIRTVVAVTISGLLVYGFSGIFAGAVRMIFLVTGLAMFLGGPAVAIVSAWQAGYRPPGFGPGPKPKGLHLGHLWVYGMFTWAFLLIAPLLSARSLAYDWANRVGIFLAIALIVGYLLNGIRVALTNPPPKHFRHANKLLVGGGLFIAFAFFFRAWGRILDALGLK